MPPGRNPRQQLVFSQICTYLTIIKLQKKNPQYRFLSSQDMNRIKCQLACCSLTTCARCETRQDSVHCKLCRYRFVLQYFKCHSTQPANGYSKKFANSIFESRMSTNFIILNVTCLFIYNGYESWYNAAGIYRYLPVSIMPPAPCVGNL